MDTIKTTANTGLPKVGLKEFYLIFFLLKIRHIAHPRAVGGKLIDILY